MKTKYIILFVLFIPFISNSQTRKREIDSSSVEDQKNPYNIRDNELINNLKLAYDSIKVFSYNCEQISWNNYGYKIDSAKLYYNKRNEFPNFEDGKTIADSDSKRLIKMLNHSYKDQYPKFTVSPYIPTMGIGFFKNDKIIAHIDISLKTSKVYLEIFKEGKKSYTYDWITMGKNMRSVFQDLCCKYQLTCCK